MSEGFVLHEKQAEVFSDPSRFRVLVAGRRFGKSRLSAAELLRAASAPKRKVWYIAPTYRMAKQIMWLDLLDSIPYQYVVKKNETAMEITLRNGSVIYLRGADNPDTLRGIEAHFAVMDEFQDIKEDVWMKIIRPALSKTRARCLFVGCVVGNTKVLSPNGMRTIKSYDSGSESKTLTPIDEELYGLDLSFHKADNFWNNGVVETRKIKTKRGFSIEASLPHPIWVMGADGVPCWKKASDIVAGDRVAIARGMSVWGDKDPTEGWNAKLAELKETKWGSSIKDIPEDVQMTDDFAYFLGLWVAEGCYDKDAYRITITCGDNVGEFLESGKVLGFKFTKSPGREDQWRINSKALCELMTYIGMPMVKSPEKWIPQWVYSGKQSWASNFISGMWDGDGSSSIGSNRAVYCSASENLVSDLQLLLTNFGVIGTKLEVMSKSTERVKVESLQHRYSVMGTDALILRGCIKPRIERKRKALANMELPAWSRMDGIPNQAEHVQRVADGIPKGSKAKKRIRDLAASSRSQESDICYHSIEEIIAKGKGTTNSEALNHLKTMNFERYYWDEVKTTDVSSAHTYDFTIPETHSFWSNGFISHNTPKSFNQLHKLWQRGQDENQRVWKSWQFPTSASPFIPLDEIRQAREEMDPFSFRQEFEAQFGSISGRVYYPFSRNTHVGDYPFNPLLPIWVGQDFNITPMSSVIMQRQPNGEIWCVDEIYLSNANTTNTCDELERRYWRYKRGLTIYPDPAGASRSSGRGESDLDIFRERGFKRIKFRKKHPPVADRVNSVNKMLLSADGAIRLRVNKSCINLITSLEQTLYKDNGYEINKKLNVEHITDALGYAIEYEYPRRRFTPFGVSI